MLRSHSLLWHYLWVGPHFWQVCLAYLLWRRGFRKRSPIFFVYLLYEGGEELTLYAMDVLPKVSAGAWWRACFAGAVMEGLLKLAVIWEVFRHLRRSDVDHRGRTLMACAAALLLSVAGFAAARAPIDRRFPMISMAHIAGETSYILASGLWLFCFLFANYAQIIWEKWDFGIALGASISACVHLGTWAVVTNDLHLKRPYLLDFLNMTIYHVCVLIWCYYLLSQNRSSMASAVNPALAETKTKMPSATKLRRLWPAARLARLF
jgi:hypothetical protein